MNEKIARIGNITLAVAIIVDVLATVAGVSRGYQELNPVVSYLMKHLGVQAVTYLGMAELGLLVAIGYLLTQRFRGDDAALFAYAELVAIVATLHFWMAMKWIFLITGE